MRTKYHLCVDIEGIMRNSNDRQLEKLFKPVDGIPQSGKYIRQWLKLQLYNGKKVLPMSDECDGFSFQTGCPGHPIPDEEITV